MVLTNNEISYKMRADGKEAYVKSVFMYHIGYLKIIWKQGRKFFTEKTCEKIYYYSYSNEDVVTVRFRFNIVDKDQITDIAKKVRNSTSSLTIKA